jgi:hypothetical protein
MRFQGQPLSSGTAFVWRREGRAYLITNWHNATGINPTTGGHLSGNAAEPDQVRVLVDNKGRLGVRGAVDLALRDPARQLLWLEHPISLRQVDVIALPLPNMPDADLFPINEMSSVQMRVTVGAEAFILGYPFAIGPYALPVWKRASIASEPDIPIDGQPRFFVDTASRSGMSGSPVIVRSSGGYQAESGTQTLSPGVFSRFVGVYSGRVGADDELQAQLGIVLGAEVIDQIIEGGRRGTAP